MPVNIDEMLSGSASDKAPSFNIEEYKRHLTSEEYKTAQIKALAENYRAQKVLQQSNFNILKTLADPEKRDKLFTAVCTVHKNILEEDNANLEVDTLMSQSFDAQADLEFLLQNKHSKFYKAAEVFDQHELHPVQKKLTKGKYIGRRSVKKQKTPMQHFNNLIEAKTKMSKDQRLEALESSMEETRSMMILLANNQVELANQLDTSQKNLLTLQETVTDLRKLKLYILLSSAKSTLTTKELAKKFEVSERTIKYWRKDLRQEGYI